MHISAKLAAIAALFFLVFGCAKTHQVMPEVNAQIWGTVEEGEKAMEAYCKDGPFQFGLWTGQWGEEISTKMLGRAEEVGQVCEELGFNTDVDRHFRLGKVLSWIGYIQWIAYRTAGVGIYQQGRGIAAGGAGAFFGIPP